MNILLIGSGAREHAIAHKLSQSIHCNKLFILPGNPGTAMHGTNVPLDPLDFSITGKFCVDNEIELLIVGPEEPLVRGMRDHFEADDKLRRIHFIGPGSAGAVLEGSKAWSKDFMKRCGIPTAAYAIFEEADYDGAIEYLRNQSYPHVLKADGLAAGK